jgi:N-acetylglucosamine-6-sulfatase
MRLMATVAALIAASLTSFAPAATPAAAVAAEQPNVVFILTDDMRASEMKYLDFTRKFLSRRGATFVNAISPHPLCCPARAELVTGQYAQSNGVWNNQIAGGFGGYDNMNGKDQTLMKWLDDVGYETSYVGKYVNGYAGGPIVGLDQNFIAVRGPYTRSKLVVENNGDPKRLTGHQTFAVQRQTSDLIRQAGDNPFFVWAGYVTPHTMKYRGRWVPPIPPAGYRGFRDRGDAIPPVTDRVDEGSRTQRNVEFLHRRRVRSLYAVDDAVKRTVQTLRGTGELDNTVIIFTSDNGYMLGERDGMMGKNHPYQASVRVPLLMAGPGIAHRTVMPVVTLVDLPTTIADLAGATPALVQDGRNAFTRPRDRAVLIQAGRPTSQWVWRGVYSRRYTYVQFVDGTVEFYDRRDDPGEVASRPRSPEARRARTLLGDLWGCSGDGCQRTY